MNVAFLPLDLPRWDECAAEALLLAIPSDVRPLRGAAGLVDWRLVGELSRALADGTYGGTSGEQLTLTTRGRLPFATVLCHGIGPSTSLTVGSASAALAAGLATLRERGVDDVACALPGRELGLLSPEQALEVLQTVRGQAEAPPRRLWVIDDASALRRLRGGWAERLDAAADAARAG